MTREEIEAAVQMAQGLLATAVAVKDDRCSCTPCVVACSKTGQTLAGAVIALHAEAERKRADVRARTVRARTVREVTMWLRDMSCALLASREECERMAARLSAAEAMARHEIGAEEDASARGHERQRFLCATGTKSAGGGYETCDALATARAEAERMRPVVEAAREWRRTCAKPHSDPDWNAKDAWARANLARAIDAYRSKA